MTSKTNSPSSSSPPPLPSSSHKITYDVFLSFRGTDTRTNFTDHLYTALKQKGIVTFRDDEELERGKSIAPSLLKAIEESRYVVVVFSQHYADSSWCLDEIAKVADCMKQVGLKVLPVFYDVDPSDVRNQKGEYFRKAFENHLRRYEGNPGKVQRWRDALSLVGNLSGWHLRNGSEAKVIQEVVQKIFTEIIQINSTSESLVGMNSHLEKLFSYLDLGHPDVRIIGICGMGGIGKTTVAQVVYEKIKNQFEGYCFLKNVRDVTEKDGVDHLQEQLLSKLLKTDVHVEYTKMGKDMILDRLSHKKVLIVLDDVNEEEQLDALCDRNWFGQGSRIIITSRDEHLLSVVEGDSVYKVSPLNDAQAFQLFSMKAFKKDQQIGEDMVKLVKEFLPYADGLPLAIEILGSSVKGRRIGLWPSMLDRLKKNPEKKLMKVLRVSFDGLEQREKQIFLDIACFFNGLSMDRLQRILQGSDANCPEVSVQVLLERSLVNLSEGRLWMHDRIQDLGCEVVCQECDIEPGRRSRLWLPKDVIRILERSKATRAVQSISLQVPTKDDVVHSLNDSFSDMDNLRLLKINNVKFSGNIKYLSNELQYLEWLDCPLDSFPSDFQPDNLVELHMLSSRIQQLWRGEKGWKMLRLIDLGGSKYLLSTPDFTQVPELEILNLCDCTSLVEVHPSLGCLKKLFSLNMINCKSVESLPPFTNLESLRYLTLSRCSRLKKFPEITGSMENLWKIYLDGTSIEELPASVACMTGLTSLDLRNCKDLLCLPSAIRCLTSMKELFLAGCSKLDNIPHDMDFVEDLRVGGTAIRNLWFVQGMKNLKYLYCQGCKGLASESYKGLRPLGSLTGLIELDLRDCSLMDAAIPDDLSGLISLKKIDLSGNNFVRLPESISQLSKLEDLDLSNCTQLQLVPSLPPSVLSVHAKDCNSLIDYPNQIKILTSPESGVTVINSLNSAHGCTQFDKVVKSSLHGDIMHVSGKTENGSTKWKHEVDFAIDKELERHSSTLPITSIFAADEIPEWFSTKSKGNHISIPIPLFLTHVSEWHGVAVCAVFSQNRLNLSTISRVDPGSDVSEHLFQCTVGTDLFQIKPAFIDEEIFTSISSFSNLLTIFYIPRQQFSLLLDQSDKIEARLETRNPSNWETRICGIRLVYEQDEQWFAKLFHQSDQTKYIVLNDVDHEGAIQNSGWLSRVDTFWKWEPCTLPGNQQSTTTLQRIRKNIESVLPRFLEAENLAVVFKFNLSGFPGWCRPIFEYPLRSSVSFKLPPNLHECKKWMGIVVYASIAQKEPHTSKRDYHVDIKLNIGIYHVNLSYDYAGSSEEPHLLFFAYIPRAEIIEVFTQTSETTLHMGFGSDSYGGEVPRGGIKIVYRQEGLEEFSGALIHCMQREDTLKHREKSVLKLWINSLRLKGDSCTPNKRYTRTRWERKFELVSQKYRNWDWCASAFRCYFFGAEFCRKKWFMHFNDGDSTKIELPPNLVGDPNWLGIAVCAILRKSHEDQNIILDTPDSGANVLSWHLEFYVPWDHSSTYSIDYPIKKLRPTEPSADWTYYMYVPRKQLSQGMQLPSAKATFWSSSPGLVIRSCALRLVYKDDIEDLVQSLTLCELP